MRLTPATARTVHFANPLEDSRWDNFIGRHPRSSVFHTSGWLDALRRTYGYTPVVLTSSPPESPLQDAWLFCSIDSWLTGRRWVSLPFSDHCQPLTDEGAPQDEFLAAVEGILARNGLRYLEIRPLGFLEYDPALLPPSVASSVFTYCFHSIDLRPGLATLFLNCHKDSIQRKIHRAARERLIYEEGRSETLLNNFHRLQVLTRRRQGLPPQSKTWFHNLLNCLGQSAKIRVAYKGKLPIAAIFTIRHKDIMVYKYGCSDTAYHNLGGIHLLMWRTIEEASRDGLRTMDLGRSDCLNQGLITFKDRWGSRRTLLTYSRFTSAAAPRDVYTRPGRNWHERLPLHLFSHVPGAVGRAVGKLLYKHLG